MHVNPLPAPIAPTASGHELNKKGDVWICVENGDGSLKCRRAPVPKPTAGR
ncbi:MAG: hypothetical protein HYX32_14080 [Actinobacteria bacterium]|nr:hypothetical protein [Actinomycetota bacterium]